MGLFSREKKVDWQRVAKYLAADEKPLDALEGWLVGASIGDNVDHPCTLFLTDDRILLDIRPQTMLPPAEVVDAPFSIIQKSGTGPNDAGGTRFVFAVDPKKSGQPEDLRGFAVDFSGRRGRDFAELVGRNCQVTAPGGADAGGSTSLEARGHFSPLLLSEQDRGGPGRLLLAPQGPLFITDRGVSHDYGWDWFEAFTVKGNELTLHTNPGDGAQITFSSPDLERWIQAFESNGLGRREQ